MCGFGCCWTNNVRTSVGYIRFFTKFKMCTTLVTTRPTLVFFFLLSGQRFWVAVLTLQCMCTLKGGFASPDLPVIWNGLTFGRCGRWWLLTLCVFCKKKNSYKVSEGRCLLAIVDVYWRNWRRFAQSTTHMFVQRQKESIGFM
jgi:hypothetical protein